MNFDDIRRQIDVMDSKLRFVYNGGDLLEIGRRIISANDESGMLRYIKDRNACARSIGLPELGPHDYMAASENIEAPEELLYDTIDPAEILRIDQELVDIYSRLESFADRKEALGNAERLLGRRNYMALNTGVPARSSESYMEEALIVFSSRTEADTSRGFVSFKRLDEQVASMDSRIMTFLRTGSGELRDMTDDQRRAYIAQRNSVAVVLGYPEETFDDYITRLKAENLREDEQLARKREK